MPCPSAADGVQEYLAHKKTPLPRTLQHTHHGGGLGGVGVLELEVDHVVDVGIKLLVVQDLDHLWQKGCTVTLITCGKRVTLITCETRVVRLGVALYRWL